jgi:hypothetical protein
MNDPSNPYTISLDDGKYTVINDNGLLTLRRHGEDWPGGDKLRYSKLVLAMAQRIEELEIAIKSVIDGTLDSRGQREADGLRSYGTQSLDIPLRCWESQLRKVLEQKP